jgi:hypothetical protein
MLRKIKFKITEDQKIEGEKYLYKSVRIEKDGYFHQWGKEEIFINDEKALIDIAIIEDTDGTVYTIEPTLIKFCSPVE